jgi:hypothetical protein
MLECATLRMDCRCSFERVQVQLREEFQILTLVQDGILTGPEGAPFGDSHVIINCPPVQRLN